MQRLQWWQKAVFYQIYPRSFADGNGDGVGDLPGIIDRLDYLQDLGIDAIWLSPHYPSPLLDCGYDITDYADVAPEYGTLDDFERLLEGAHQRDLRVILDLVLNHTSHQHPWFVESRSGRDNPKRDWYVWRDGKGGSPPNNWYSGFGGSAWEYDPRSGQYYYHYFLKEQPDLNWRNPEVKQAMWEMVRFWLDLGVDGFRLDAIGTIFEDPALPNHSATLSQVELHQAFQTASSPEERKALGQQAKTMFKHQVEQPGIHELMQELRALVDEYPDRVLVGENDKIAYYGDGDNELHLVFNFPLMRTERLTPAWVRDNQRARLEALPPGAWPCNTLNNHDTSRVYSRYGSAVRRPPPRPTAPAPPVSGHSLRDTAGAGSGEAALARLSLALMLTLRGTPFLYNGEEIGMTDLLLEDISQFRDTRAIRAYQLAINELGTPPEQALPMAARLSRDRCRTPMQWADAPNAGFSPAGVQTWLPVNPNYAQGVNVADQLADPDSLLHFYRHLLHLRKETPALVAGDYMPLHTEALNCLAFIRHSRADKQVCLVVLNTSDQAHTLHLDLQAEAVRPLFSSHARAANPDNPYRLSVAPFEIYIGELVIE